MKNDSSFLPWKQATGAALLDLERRADRALAGLVPVSQNVYNLILRDYYEGKYTGWKQAMVFDGFLDGSMIESLTAGFEWSGAGHRLYLDNIGKDTRDTGFGKRYTTALAAGESLTQTWKVDRLGMAGWIEMYGSGTLSLDIQSASGHYHKVYERSSKGTDLELLSFPFTIELDAGEVYTLTLTAKTAAVVGRASGTSFGWLLYMAEVSSAEQGVLVTNPIKLDSRFYDIKLFLRRSIAPNPVASLWDETNQVWLPLNCTGSHDAHSISGESCSEVSYDLSVPEGLRTVKLKLEVDAYPTMGVTIYDYCVMAL